MNLWQVSIIQVCDFSQYSPTFQDEYLGKEHYLPLTICSTVCMTDSFHCCTARVKASDRLWWTDATSDHPAMYVSSSARRSGALRYSRRATSSRRWISCRRALGGEQQGQGEQKYNTVRDLEIKFSRNVPQPSFLY